MSTSRTENHGVRQLAVLATIAACVASATLLVGSVMAGLAGLAYGVPLVLAALAFVGVALFGGWAPGLYLGLAMIGIGAVIAGDDLTWVQAIVLAITISGVHEASRFSLDARKPTRLGAGLLARTSLGALAGAGVAVVAGVVARRFGAGDPSVYWVPLALAAVSVPLFAARLVEIVAPRLSRRPQGPPAALMATGAGAVAVVVVVVVTMAARGRAVDRRDDVSVPELTPTLVSEEFGALYPEQVSGSLATLFGLFLAAAVIGLLYGAFHRRQLLLVQDDIELDLDDSRFAFSLPDAAELEDVGLDIGRTVELIDALLVDLDDEVDPGRAIRFAYARVEQQLAAVDLAPGEAETAHEFLRRALPALGDGRALERLTDVFEQARFDTVAVTEGHRAGAREALQDLQDQLQDLARRHVAARAEHDAAQSAGNPTAAANPRGSG